MKLFKIKLTLFSLLIAIPVFGSNEISNLKSGISIGITGSDDVDYVFERWYDDKSIDDHGVIYIKDSVNISFFHNERNSAWVNYKLTQLSGDNSDKGIIRYKVDRDLQIKYGWGEGSVPEDAVLTAYSAPFSFNNLNYGPEDPDVSVVGTTGPKPDVLISNRKEYYYRGLLDSFGDEWHTIAVGDGDSWVGYGNSGYELSELRQYWASDGKIHYFIVNPKTPAIYFKSSDNSAHYYTTPVKNYFIPKLYDQTTYVSGNVNIHLVNIMDTRAVYYKWDGDSEFTLYNSETPLTTENLSDGEHTLEYYYNEDIHRTRKIVKNPGYPSDNDMFSHDSKKHGYLLWKDDNEFAGIKDRITSDNSTFSELTKRYKFYKDDTSKYGNGQDTFESIKGKGLRYNLTNLKYPLSNAIVAKMEGLENGSSYASYAKRMMFESQYMLDPLGYELDHNFSGIPSAELISCGYYQAQSIMAIAFAYDLLIMNYRSSDYADGFTAIEDIKIRDTMAKYILTALMWRGGYTVYQRMGMWGGARNVGALIAALAMPSYNTDYSGVSGFNGEINTNKWLPFQDQAITWKQAFYDDNIERKPYPNQQGYMGIKESVISYNQNGRLYTIEDGNIKDDGTSMVGGYTTYHLMGSIIGIYSNVMKIKFDKQFQYLNDFFNKCLDGTQPISHTVTVGYYPNVLVMNEHHPVALSQKAWNKTELTWDDSTKNSDPFQQTHELMKDEYILMFMHGPGSYDEDNYPDNVKDDSPSCFIRSLFKF